MYPCGLLVIVGCYNFSLTILPAVKQAFMVCMVIAEWVILRECKSLLPSCFKKWLNNLVSCIYLEEVWYTMSNAHTKFLKVQETLH